MEGGETKTPLTDCSLLLAFRIMFACRSVILTQIKIELKFILILLSVHHCMIPLFSFRYFTPLQLLLGDHQPFVDPVFLDLLRQGLFDS